MSIEQGAARGLSRNVAAASSLILGVIGIPSMVADPAFALLFGIAAMAVGVIGLRQARTVSSGRGLAIAGITLGILTLVVFVVLVALISHDGIVPITS
jgi:hypothetical protein